MVGSFVGGDVTAGILASGMHASEELSLLIDLGTNGEVVLGNRDFLVACSASAGPAFEGGSVSCGMRATFGAIDSVRISPHGCRVAVSTIDGGPPLGLCGTGLIDALAEMFLAGLVDRSGHFQVHRAPDRFRISREDEPAGVRARSRPGRRQRSATWSSPRPTWRTSSAPRPRSTPPRPAWSIRWGSPLPTSTTSISQGPSATSSTWSNCITTGLLPDVPLQRIRFIGNSSVAGAKLVMLSQEMLAEIHRVRDRITYEELMVNPRYMDDFLSACFLPHTDLAQFPSVAERLRGASRDGEATDATCETRAAS